MRANKKAEPGPSKKPAAERSSGISAFASSYLSTYGHGVVVVACEKAAKCETATFVIDAHCLGVRKAVRSSVPALTFLNKVLPALHAEHHTTPIPTAVAMGIVAGAVSFAKSAGFSPAEGFDGAFAVFGETEPAPAPFPFGKAGKPHFHPMPGDDEEFAETVIGKLRRLVGPSGFTYDLDELEEDHLDGDDDAGEPGEGRED